MQSSQVTNFIKKVVENMPSDWLNLTTHRLDIYEEKLAKVQFLESFEQLFESETADRESLLELPTAFDYIRLGHPLSCVLEWTIAKLNKLSAESVIGFSSKTTPILAVLRKNLLEARKTRICYVGQLPLQFDAEILREIYRYDFELNKVESIDGLSSFDGKTILLTSQNNLDYNDIFSHASANKIDFLVSTFGRLGSVIIVNGEINQSYISEIQHVRRRRDNSHDSSKLFVGTQCLC